MLRHLKNINELVLYGSISCGLAFFVRINPAFFWAVLLFRIAVLGYSAYVVSYLEDNKILGIMLGAAVFIGAIGGNFDWIILQLTYNQSAILMNGMLIFAIVLMGGALILHYRGGSNAQR